MLALLPHLHIAEEVDLQYGAGSHGACDPIAEDEAQQDGGSDASLVQLRALARAGSVLGTNGSAKSQAGTARERAFLGANSTLLGWAQAELEYELHMGQDPHNAKIRNKASLAIVSLLGLGFCGVDRCCMGQIFIGFMKGMSFGGLFLWFLIDYVVIMVNCLFWSRHLNSAAWYTTFQKSSVLPAFLIVLIVLILKLLCACHKPQRNMVTIIALCRRRGLISMRPKAFEMREMFARAHSNEDGFIDMGELNKAMVDLGRPLTDTEIGIINEKVGKDGDGNLKIDDLVDLLSE